MTNAEAWFNKSLRPRKPEGSLGQTAQDVHLDSHTAPELAWLRMINIIAWEQGTAWLYKITIDAWQQTPSGLCMVNIIICRKKQQQPRTFWLCAISKEVWKQWIAWLCTISSLRDRKKPDYTKSAWYVCILNDELNITFFFFFLFFNNKKQWKHNLKWNRAQSTHAESTDKGASQRLKAVTHKLSNKDLNCHGNSHLACM